MSPVHISVPCFIAGELSTIDLTIDAEDTALIATGLLSLGTYPGTRRKCLYRVSPGGVREPLPNLIMREPPSSYCRPRDANPASLTRANIKVTTATQAEAAIRERAAVEARKAERAARGAARKKPRGIHGSRSSRIPDTGH